MKITSFKTPYILLAFCILLGFCLQPKTAEAQLISQNKITRQSSNYTSSSGLSRVAVDGNTHGVWGGRSVTHTATPGGKGTKDPWWEVDLGSVYEITKIEIWNRTDCCKQRLSNFNILIDGQRLLSSNKIYRSGESYPLRFNSNLRGRRVRIKIYGIGILSLAEVKVYGRPARAANDPEIARGKSARQSSNYTSSSGLARNAVDGNTNGIWGGKSVTHTATPSGRGTNNPWWEVDLGKKYDISKIEIWNRTDCCKERLTNFNILVDGQKFLPSNRVYTAGQANPLRFNGRKTGRVVRIQLYGNRILSLAEVKVYGLATQSPSPAPSPSPRPSPQSPSPAPTNMFGQMKGKWTNKRNCQEYYVSGEITERWVPRPGGGRSIEMVYAFLVYDDYAKYQSGDQIYRRNGKQKFLPTQRKRVYQTAAGKTLTINQSGPTNNPTYSFTLNNNSFVKGAISNRTAPIKADGIWKRNRHGVYLRLSRSGVDLRVEEAPSPTAPPTKVFNLTGSCADPNTFTNSADGTIFRIKRNNYIEEYRKSDGRVVKTFYKYTNLLDGVAPDGGSIESSSRDLTSGVNFFRKRGNRWVKVSNNSSIRDLINGVNVPTIGERGRNEDWYLIPMDASKVYQFEVFSDEFEPRIAHSRKYDAQLLSNSWRGSLGGKRAQLKDFRPPLNQNQWIVISTVSAPNRSNANKMTGKYSFNYTEYNTSSSNGVFSEMSSVALNNVPVLNRGETNLYLNFDGFNINDLPNGTRTRTIGSTTQFRNTTFSTWTSYRAMTGLTPAGFPSIDRERIIQEIMYRTSEIYAPFNIVVSRLIGRSNFINTRNHSTMFIGADQTQGRFGVQFRTTGSVDFGNKNLDLGWVNYRGNNGQDDIDGIAQTIAHEGGHSFGLIHIRSSGSDAPGNQSLRDWIGNGQPNPNCPAGFNSSSTTPEVMSYDSDNAIFEDVDHEVTGWNNDGNGVNNPSVCGGANNPLSNLSRMFPTWSGQRIIMQNSYRYMMHVVGGRSFDRIANVANRDAILQPYERNQVYLKFRNPSRNTTSISSADRSLLDNASPTAIRDAVNKSVAFVNNMKLYNDPPYKKFPGVSLIDYLGDYDVHLYTANADKTLTISCQANNESGLDPVLLVYDASGKKLLGYHDNISNSNNTARLSLPVKRGQSYKVVVGAKDNATTGSYNLQW